MKIWPALLALLLAATGCSLIPGDPKPAASSYASPLLDLSALREQHELPECPDTDQDAEAVPDGLPATSLSCLGTDQEVNLAGLPRKPMVINLWAQWCGPCREEAPYLAEAAIANPDVAFLGINFGDPRPDWAIEFAGISEWKYPHLQDLDKELASDLQILGLPTTFFVDADGRIVGRFVGVFLSTAELNAEIESKLG